MTNLDRLYRLVQFKTSGVIFTETDEFIQLEFNDNVFKKYIMKGDNVERAKEEMFWYIIEKLIENFKAKEV